MYVAFIRLAVELRDEQEVHSIEGAGQRQFPNLPPVNSQPIFSIRCRLHQEGKAQAGNKSPVRVGIGLYESRQHRDKRT